MARGCLDYAMPLVRSAAAALLSDNLSDAESVRALCRALDDPLRVAVTVALSLLTWGAVRRLSEHVILFGRRRFAVFIIVSFLLRFAMGFATTEADLPVTAAMVIGYLVPGILAHEIDRQGVVKTLSSMLMVAVALKLLFLAFMKSGW